MNKRARNAIVLLIALALGSPFFAYAVSYSTSQELREEKLARGIRDKGNTVCLFQSGTADVQKEIHISDILIVYRKTAQVGKIKVLSFAGADYLTGVVIEGQVRAGDIARKGEVASLVISDKCK